jgi:hypothetical protein
MAAEVVEVLTCLKVLMGVPAVEVQTRLELVGPEILQARLRLKVTMVALLAPLRLIIGVAVAVALLLPVPVETLVEMVEMELRHLFQVPQ